MIDEFILWMQSLDAEKVAATESFHSQNHRDWVALHEFEKSRIAAAHYRLANFQRQLTRIDESWTRRDQRANRKAETVRERVVANPIPDFTQKQIDIAVMALNKGNK